MAKKTEPKSKAAAPAVPAAPVKTITKPSAKAKPAAVIVKEPAAAKKPAAKAKTAAKIVAEPVVKPAEPVAKPAKAVKVAKPAKAPKAVEPVVPVFTTDDVALRAYFISEKRRAHGLPGNEHQDWLEAERQLTAESQPAKKTKKA
jgi:hypothetical protein